LKSYGKPLLTKIVQLVQRTAFHTHTVYIGPSAIFQHVWHRNWQPGRLLLLLYLLLASWPVHKMKRQPCRHNWETEKYFGNVYKTEMSFHLKKSVSTGYYAKFHTILAILLVMNCEKNPIGVIF